MTTPSTPTTMVSHMPTNRFVLRPTLLLSAAMLPLLAACDATPAPDEDVAARAPAVSVSVATVTSDTRASAVTATGTFGSRDEIPLAFKIGPPLPGPKDSAPVFELQEVHRKFGDRPGRVAALERALAIDPNSYDARFLSAMCLFDAGRWDQAREQLEWCLQRRPGVRWRTNPPRTRCCPAPPATRPLRRSAPWAADRIAARPGS